MSYPLKSLCLTLSVMTSSVAAIGSASMERPPVGSSSFSSPCAAREVSPTIALGVIQEAKRFVAEKEKEFGPAAYGGTIDVYWNTIKSSSGLGYLSTSTIQKQIQDINNAFAPGSWRFNLASVRTYTNDDWFYNIRYGDDEPMKRSLYRGDSHNLNIYSMQLADDVLGWATFPWDFEENTYTDGVVLGYNTLAGNGFEGDTGIHEVGHWMGLLHTFQGGCSDTYGDFVDDTPPVAEPNHGCPVGIDSCYGGDRDLVRNFMDYTDDSCMDSFTNGQYDNVQYLWSRFRAPGSHGRDDVDVNHENSASSDFMHAGLYGVLGLVGVMAIVGGILYKKKREQDELDNERMSEWVGDMADIDNPLRQTGGDEADIEIADLPALSSVSQEEKEDVDVEAEGVSDAL